MSPGLRVIHCLRIPNHNSPNTMKPVINSGWFMKESVREIIAVLGSKTHRYPAKKVKTIETNRTTGRE